MRHFLLSLFVACSLGAVADEGKTWTLVEQPTGQSVAVSNVAFLLVADDADAFSVVCKDGTVDADVTSVSFSQTDASAIVATKTSGQTPTLIGSVENSLRLSNCRAGASITIYSANGQQLQQLQSNGGTTTVNVSTLPHGVYLLTVDKTTIKFMKK